MSARVRTVSAGVAATLRRSTLPCVRAEYAQSQAGFRVWQSATPSTRVLTR